MAAPTPSRMRNILQAQAPFLRRLAAPFSLRICRPTLRPLRPPRGWPGWREASTVSRSADLPLCSTSGRRPGRTRGGGPLPAAGSRSGTQPPLTPPPPAPEGCWNPAAGPQLCAHVPSLNVPQPKPRMLSASPSQGLCPTGRGDASSGSERVAPGVLQTSRRGLRL